MTCNILFFLALPFAVTSYGQELDLVPLNTAFTGSVTFKFDKQDRLVMDFMDHSGRYREDIVPLTNLDPESVHFSAEENAIVLECSKDKAQCFTKEIFKLDVVRLTSRSTLPKPENDANGATTIALFQDLIRAALNEPKETADETTPDRVRKKAR